MLGIRTWKLLVTTVTLISIIESVRSTNSTSSPLNSPEFMKKAGQFASRMLLMYNHKTHRRSFMFPKKTILTLTPKITFPVFKQKATKGGLQSDFQASMVFYMKLDELGMTTDSHMLPFDVPPFYPYGDHMPTSGGGGQEEKVKDKGKVPSYMTNKDGGPKPFPFIKEDEGESSDEEGRKSGYTFVPISRRQGEEGNRGNHRVPRSVMSLPPPESIHGGERAIILPSIENHLTSFGFDSGRGCMLRAICEVHELPLAKIGYGVIGEMITLLFSISESEYAETHMPEYLRAEKNGKVGDCSEYYKNCGKSIFKWEPRNNTQEEMRTSGNEI